MAAGRVDDNSRSYWLVGASWDENDQTDRFLEEGIWENGYDDRFIDTVCSMRPGDQIAIKATYRRKHHLPFDNDGHDVSVMAINATGTITGNSNDGKRVDVAWNTREHSPREWYFSTYWQTVHKIDAGENWRKDQLIAFAFEGADQDIERFLAHPRWHDQYGAAPEDQRFPWTRLYEAIADKLLDYRRDRRALIQAIHDIANRAGPLTFLQDRFADGSTGPLEDICPFTTMAAFNRGMTDANRHAVAKEIASHLGVDIPVPDAFPGIPVVNNQRTWFFGYSRDRRGGDIDMLWNVLVTALRFADEDTPETREELTEAYDQALEVKGVAWNLSMALYWVRPWDFAPLDEVSRNYISHEFGMSIPTQATLVDGERYLRIRDSLRSRFDDETCPVQSFPELSLAAWNTARKPDAPPVLPKPVRPPVDTYSVTNVLDEGCFLEHREIERILERLRTRKNVILQGPPGTGKTWLAKRLAFALVGARDATKVRSVQFHPNLSYEDFVRGWRPMGDGKLDLAEGVFMEMIHDAAENRSANFAVVIEEVNRGNPAQIFGEMLTLLEADKRSPRDAVEICYPDKDGKRQPVWVPENLHVIGTMNIADRSLALVDFALRRRFAFVTLKPCLGKAWREWVVRECGLDQTLVTDIGRRITALNDRIAADSSLGRQFQIGHSYVTPTHRVEPGTTRDWFRQVVQTEISPLLEEYWFDSPKQAAEATLALTEGW